jgi:simple sugar transport system permease protein
MMTLQIETKKKDLSLVLEFLLIVFALIIGLGLGCLLGWWAGERPERIIQIIFDGAFGTPYDIGMVLYFSTILICTGLAVAIPLQAGVFNIGAEGQVLIGAFAAGMVGAFAPSETPHIAALFMSVIAAIAAAGLWGALAAWIRAYRGGHEVISSIMLNFVAAGITSWLVISYFQAEDSQNPELPSIHDAFKLGRLMIFDGAPVTIALLLAASVVGAFALVIHKLSSGYRMKVVRQAPEAAVVAGYDPKKFILWSFTCGSAVCGIAGAVMVMGESWRFRVDMAEGFGFLGIPVALLGRGRPVGVFFAALLFAILHHGSGLLDIESDKVGRDLAQVIEAIVVLSVITLPPALRLFRSSSDNKASL